MTTAPDLKKILIKKYHEDQLASVYLANYTASTDPKVWAKSFLEPITTLSDHPDILWVERTETENDYKVESPGILALLKFLNFRPYKLKKKFIFITDAHLMSVIVSNKLLKVFEELPENFSLILFAPQDQPLLPTVESRAIKILLPQDFSKAKDKSLDELHYESAQELMASLKKSDDDYQEEKNFIEASLTRVLQRARYSECAEALEDLKHFGVSEDFNNSKLARLSLFFK